MPTWSPYTTMARLRLNRLRQAWSGSARTHGTADRQTVALENRSDHERQLSLRSITALAVSAAIVLLVIAGYFRYVARYATNWVVWDEWNWVELMRRSSGGGLTPGGLWGEHKEKWVVFPQLIVLLLGGITGGR